MPTDHTPAPLTEAEINAEDKLEYDHRKAGWPTLIHVLGVRIRIVTHTLNWIQSDGTVVPFLPISSSGWCSARNGMIGLSPEQSDDQAQLTLLHEIIHAVDCLQLGSVTHEEKTSELSELQVSVWSVGLFQCLRDPRNADAVGWMLANPATLAAALAIPDNHVRLPSGEVVRVLGTLPMTADGCVCGVGGTIYIDSIIQKQVVACELADGRSGWLTSPVCYSTREAAESARAGGGA